MNDIGKNHMKCSIHMDGALLVLLIKFYMKAIFGPVIELFYCLSSTNQYSFTFSHNGTIFYDKYISSKNKKNLLMMMGVEFYQTRGYKELQLKISTDLFKSILCY